MENFDWYDTDFLNTHLECFLNLETNLEFRYNLDTCNEINPKRRGQILLPIPVFE